MKNIKKITNFDELRKGISNLKSDCENISSIIRGLNSFRGRDFSDTATTSLHNLVELDRLAHMLTHLQMSSLTPSVFKAKHDSLVTSCNKELVAIRHSLVEIRKTALNLLNIAAASEASQLGLSQLGSAPACITDLTAHVQYQSVKGYWTYAFIPGDNFRGKTLGSTPKRPEYALFYCYDFLNAKINHKFQPTQMNPVSVTRKFDSRLKGNKPLDDLNIYDADILNAIPSENNRETTEMEIETHVTTWFQFSSATGKKLTRKRKDIPIVLKIGKSDYWSTLAPPLLNFTVYDNRDFFNRGMSSSACINMATNLGFVVKPSVQRFRQAKIKNKMKFTTL